MTASFRRQNPAMQHQKTMPAAPARTRFPPKRILPASWPTCCRRRSKKFLCDKPLEIRPSNSITSERTLQNQRVRSGSAPTAQCRKISAPISLCWATLDLTSCPLPCSLTASVFWSRAWVGFITQCGSIARSTSTTGCWTALRAPPPPARAVLSAASSTQDGTLVASRCRKASCVIATRKSRASRGEALQLQEITRFIRRCRRFRRGCLRPALHALDLPVRAGQRSYRQPCNR